MAKCAVVALTALGIIVSLGAPASGAAQDYEFQLVQDVVPQADDVILTVRLIHKPTAKPVPHAVVFARRLDMAPDGMATMMADLTSVPSDEPGVYRFQASFSMEGNWRLSLAAKVQGETETVQTRLIFKAKN